MPTINHLTAIEQRSELEQFLRILSKFRDVYAEMPVAQMMLFIFIGKNEAMTQRDIATALAMPTSSVSRNLATMSDLKLAGEKAGLGLITWQIHPTDRRAKLVVMTPKGTGLLKSLL